MYLLMNLKVFEILKNWISNTCEGGAMVAHGAHTGLKVCEIFKLNLF